MEHNRSRERGRAGGGSEGTTTLTWLSSTMAHRADIAMPWHDGCLYEAVIYFIIGVAQLKWDNEAMRFRKVITRRKGRKTIVNFSSLSLRGCRRTRGGRCVFRYEITASSL
ncbi:hypothetical protein PUN28_008431 [Cardiocondyla obscurior]|uniref:Uncharacterized protein n=1 Tax=Cardiocondyla obscurior TaxID=286306 RepID=A0AAW2G133_9HYME